VQLSTEMVKEAEYRRLLFKAAAKGDVSAQKELEREYHVRISSSKNSRSSKRRTGGQKDA
jgi:hypothetical protein